MIGANLLLQCTLRQPRPVPVRAVDHVHRSTLPEGARALPCVWSMTYTQGIFEVEGAESSQQYMLQVNKSLYGGFNAGRAWYQHLVVRLLKEIS